MQSFMERADRVHGGGVDSSVDNMLSITNDGRSLALDQRLLNHNLPESEHSKAMACAKMYTVSGRKPASSGLHS